MRARPLQVTGATSARRVLAERGGIGVTIGFYVIVVSAITALWRAAAQANGGQVAGYTAAALTWYLVTSEAATVSLDIRLIEQIGEDIAEGAIAVELLRPASVLAVRVAIEVGRALPRLAACVAAGVVLSLLLVGGPPDGAALVLAVPSLLLAIVCNLLAQHAFAAAAFWIRDARSTWFLYQKLVFVVGGMLLPLEVLPGWLHSIATALPFSAMAYAPARLASGHFQPALLVMQAGWVCVLTALAVAAFAAGEKRLQVLGG
jgi:ABC-2 type transport system permease protein